jgi:DNA-binding beta-propeller fold protein YncE
MFTAHSEEVRMRVRPVLARSFFVLIVVSAIAWYALSRHTVRSASADGERGGSSEAIHFSAPAGDRPATRHILIDGVDAAILPNGRILTPAGVEISVDAPKPYGLALSPDGGTVATINSGVGPFSVTLIRNVRTSSPSISRIDVSSSFMGVTFSSDSSRFYASGGENGMIWVGATNAARIIGSVNLNGPGHPFGAPMDPTENPVGRFKGTFPGNLALGPTGRYLYVVEQGSFDVFVIDTRRIVTGFDPQGRILEPNNFPAVVGRVKAGRYPYAVAPTPDGRSLLVANVGVFQYTHLTPANPTGNPNHDYPLGYPGAGYPDETEHDRTIRIKKVDPRNLPTSLRDPDGIRVGYIDQDIDYVVPGLGSPNAPESSSVYVYSLSNPTTPSLAHVVRTGPGVGEVEHGIQSFGGSHPNAIAVGPDAIYVSNGNNDSISVLDRQYREGRRISLSLLRGTDRRLKGVQPVALALSPDARFLYVAEAGINAVAVLGYERGDLKVLGHIPTGWWPSSVRVSADGSTLYVANAKGRGAGPFDDVPPDNIGSPKASTIGSMSIIPVPDSHQLEVYTRQVLRNNGFRSADGDRDHDVRSAFGDSRDEGRDRHPIPSRPGQASRQIKHIIFVNKENSTHDQMLGDIVVTRRGVPVEGKPTYSLGYNASPNHHELALSFAFSDNFYLEPAVSSDGHRWLTNTYTTEFEDTHWPASYGGQRRDAGDDPNVFGPYPGRLGFTDANSSAEPNDYNQHGSLFLHLARNGHSFVNFGNGYEFAQVDEDFGTEPTGIRQHVNVPMEKVLRDNSDHLYPEYNTHIPDAPLPEDPQRFSRFGRFKQVFESRYVDRRRDVCRLPSYVDLYYPNDHGGGAFDIHPNGPAWSYTRFVQDNDTALGLTVELISNSPCWRDTVIFVVEDDPQNGLDHVDGYRSIFLAISPWVKREHVSKRHLSLASIFKTVNLILGLPPHNQYDAAASDLREMFTSRPDYRPYHLVPVQYAKGASQEWIAATRAIDFSEPDDDEVKLRAAILKSEGLPRPERPAPAHP